MLLAMAAGVEAEIYAARPGRLPARPSAVIITGGPGSPEDPSPWRRRLQAASDAWAKKIPVLAIGLGFEVLAQAQGWAVRPLDAPRDGWYPLTLTANGSAHPLLMHAPQRSQIFEQRSWGILPPSAATESRNVVLAYSSAGDVAAARFGARTVGMIFHPEAQGGPADALPSQLLTDFLRQALETA